MTKVTVAALVAKAAKLFPQLFSRKNPQRLTTSDSSLVNEARTPTTLRLGCTGVVDVVSCVLVLPMWICPTSSALLSTFQSFREA
jgi:hypothetical protein